MYREGKSAVLGLTGKIKALLSEENMVFKDVQDPSSNLHLLVWPLPNQTIRILVKDDKVIVINQLVFNSLFQSKYLSLVKSKKREFLKELQKLLLAMNTDYGLLPYKNNPNFDRLEGFQISKKIFSDGLTKDKLFDTISLVLKGSVILHMMQLELNVTDKDNDDENDHSTSNNVGNNRLKRRATSEGNVNEAEEADIEDAMDDNFSDIDKEVEEIDDDDEF